MTRAITLCVCLALSTSSWVAYAQNQPVRYFMKTPKFYLPFQMDAERSQGWEIYLHVSEDQGKTWRLYQHKPAGKGSFLYEASRDGEYWFSPQLVLADRQPPPPKHQAQWQVFVDTEAPSVRLRTVVGPDSMIYASWEASDSRVDPRSIRLDYQFGENSPWREVASGAAPVAPNDSQHYRGQASWRTPPMARKGKVRLRVRDAAKNEGVAEREVVLSSLRETVLREPRSGAPAVQPPASLILPPPPPASLYAPQPPVAATSPQPTSPQPTSPQPTSPQPTSPPANASWAPDPPPGSTKPRQPIEPPIAMPRSPGRLASNNVNRPQSEPAPAPPIPPAPLVRGVRRSGPFGLPAGERPQMTRSRRFELEYDVQAAAPEGVERVVLWVTRDGGVTWKESIEDEDRTSPLVVKLPEEGVYGFRIVVVGVNGRFREPVAGDLADLWVGVDVTPPLAKITNAAYGRGEKAGHLDIRWEAQDRYLGARPASLLFSEHPQGPWTTLASGLPGSGKYDWRVDARAPEKFYLRLEIRDQAGNQGFDQLSEPLLSAALAPKGVIRGLKPLLEE